MTDVTENHNRRKERNPECYNCGRSLKMEEETEISSTIITLWKKSKNGRRN